MRLFVKLFKKADKKSKQPVVDGIQRAQVSSAGIGAVGS